MTLIPLFLSLIFSAQFGLKVDTTFDIPDTDEYFLENPLSFDIDQDGNLYMVDGEAKVIFSWDKNGKFLKTIGKPGQGPGEFSFSGRGPSMGFIYVIDSKLYIFDGIKRKVMIYGVDGKFIESPELNLPRSRTEDFIVLDDNRFLVHFRRFKDDRFVKVIRVIDNTGKEVKVYRDQEDDTVKFKMQNGRPSNMTFKVYNPTLTIGFNAASSDLLIGHSGDPFLEIHDKSGASKKIQLPIVQRDVTQADQDEFNASRAETQRRRPVKFTFPEKMPFYSKLVPLEDGSILAYHESPYDHKLDGFIMDREGNAKGKLSAILGEGGGLLNARGKLLKYSLNEEDEFEFSLVSLVIK